jgi:hypothetical protein
LLANRIGKAFVFCLCVGSVWFLGEDAMGRLCWFVGLVVALVVSGFNAAAFACSVATGVVAAVPVVQSAVSFVAAPVAVASPIASAVVVAPTVVSTPVVSPALVSPAIVSPASIVAPAVVSPLVALSPAIAVPVVTAVASPVAFVTAPVVERIRVRSHRQFRTPVRSLLVR